MTNEHIALLRQAKLSWLYPIYVPSYSRAGIAPFLELLKGIPSNLISKLRVHIVVRPEEMKAYRREYPWATVIPEKQPGIGPARMRCLIHAEARGYRNIVVFDDDIRHISLLERLEDEGRTRRVSAQVAKAHKPMHVIRTLAVACRLSDSVFNNLPMASYGAARNGLFSGDVDTAVGATLNKGSFPACVMFFDVYRFTMRKMPEPYHFHGEDLAMFLDNMEHGQFSFTLPGVAYDQHQYVETTIPLDPQDAVGRPHLETTEQYYPKLHPYLRVSMRNKLGGVMRIGVNWSRWYKDTGTEAAEVPLLSMIKEK